MGKIYAFRNQDNGYLWRQAWGEFLGTLWMLFLKLNPGCVELVKISQTVHWGLCTFLYIHFNQKLVKYGCLGWKIPLGKPTGKLQIGRKIFIKHLTKNWYPGHLINSWWEWSVSFLKWLNKHLPYNPTFSLQGIYPKEMKTYVCPQKDLCRNVHGNITPNWKTTQTPIKKMDK